MEDFINWSIIKKNVFKNIAELLKEIGREPFTGKGKPEALKHQLKGYWSRRINDEQRLVYFVNEQNDIENINCKGYYE